MKRLSRTLVLMIVLAATLLAALPAAAQESKSKTWTEAQINASYRVTNPARRSISNIHVDLQPGQAVVTATYTRRGQSPVATSTTLVPYIDDGRIYWEVTSVLANGQPASDELIAQINLSIVSAWRNYIRRQAGTGHFTAVTITGGDLTVTYTPFASGS